MTKAPPRAPPRVGVNDAEDFVGEPIPQPKGLNPFNGREDDASGERDAALELLPNMMRPTGTYPAVDEPRPLRSLTLVAVLAGFSIIGIALYAWLRP